MPSDLSADSKFTSAEDSHPANDAPRPDTGQTWHEIVNRRAFSNLRQRRIGQNKIRNIAKIEISRYRQNPHSNQFARLLAGFNTDTFQAELAKRPGNYLGLIREVFRLVKVNQGNKREASSRLNVKQTNPAPGQGNLKPGLSEETTRKIKIAYGLLPPDEPPAPTNQTVIRNP